MNIEFSLPSKTFLLGEYYVLQSGRAVLFNTTPRFKMTASLSHESQKSVENLFHEKSPAGLYWIKNPALSRWSFQFYDPHEHKGGWGASSAQFVFLYVLNHMIEAGDFTEKQIYSNRPKFDSTVLEIFQSENDPTHPTFIKKMLREYKLYSPLSSGADIISQLLGDFVAIDFEKYSYFQYQSWPFLAYNFFLVRTGIKVPTHDHLNEIFKSDSQERAALLTSLQWPYDLLLSSLQNKNINQFVTAIDQYQKKLIEFQLVSDITRELLSALNSTPEIVAVKGCGALGADVLFVLFKKENTEKVKDRLSLLQLEIVASQECISSGLSVTVNI